MSWKAWAARIGGYAAAPWTGGASIPIGEAVAEGIGAHDAANKASQQQGAATGKANARLDSAGAVDKQVFDSQRRDYQSLANSPYQSLAQLSGINIPNVTPLATGPSGGGLTPGTLGAVTPAVQPQAPAGAPVAAPTMPAPAQQFASGYRNPNGVQMRGPDGQVFLIPHHQREEALANGGVEAG